MKHDTKCTYYSNKIHIIEFAELYQILAIEANL